jgi:hypothetical protein
VAPGGGGGSGVYLAFSLTISPTDLVVTWAAGSGGAGGSTAGGNGVTGGDTTLTVGGKTYTAKGGTGGVGGLNTALAAANAGGRPQSGSSPAPRVGGTEGDRGISVGGVFYGGSGGDNPMGVGGFTVDGNTAGVDALGPGGGGGGACATGTGLVGGNGLSGKILVWAKT